MRSLDPVQQRSASAELTAGDDGLFSLSASAGGGLSQDLSGRFSLHRFESDGFRHNAFLAEDDSNGRVELSARGKLLWNFHHDWESLLTGLYMDFDNGYDAWTVNNDKLVHSDHPGRDSQQTLATSVYETVVSAGRSAGRVAGWVDTAVRRLLPDSWERYILAIAGLALLPVLPLIRWRNGNGSSWPVAASEESTTSSRLEALA